MPAELFEQFHAADGFRHKNRGFGHIFQRLRSVLRQQQLADADDAHHLVERVFAHRIPRVRAHIACRQFVQRLRHRGVRIQPHHLVARHHDGRERALIELENVAHHAVLVLFDQPGIHTFDQTGGNFFLGHAARGLRVKRQQAQYGMRGVGQQQHKGARGARQPGHGARHEGGNLLGIDLPDALGHQFAKNQRDKGDACHHQSGGGKVRHALGRARQQQPARHDGAEGRIAHNAVEQADRGDADLHGREKVGRVLHQGQRRRSAGLLGGGQRIQPRLAAGGQRHFRHGKQAIE